MAKTVADDEALAALWDAEHNDEPADKVLAKSHKTRWWRCEVGHSF